MRLYNKIIVLMVCMAAISSILRAQTAQQQVMVTYSDFYPKTISGYRYLVVEPYFFSKDDVAILRKNNSEVYAYISVGEVDKGSWFYKDLKDVSLAKNPIWNSEIVTLANTKTAEVLHRLVDSYIEDKGFNGIFLDNVDNYTRYGPTPEDVTHLIDFLQAVKKRHPTIRFMQNAGVEIIELTAPLVDVLAIESVATDYNFKTNTYRLREASQYLQRANQVDAIRERYNLPIIAIEYANTPHLLEQTLKRLEPWPWLYFIGQIELQGTPVFKEN
jgi:hypothetical protein